LHQVTRYHHELLLFENLRLLFSGFDHHFPAVEKMILSQDISHFPGVFRKDLYTCPECSCVSDPYHQLLNCREVVIEAGEEKSEVFEKA